MSNDDHLSGETSLSLSLTDIGVNAKAKSRIISAIDRLGGNLGEYLNVFLEERFSHRRSVIDGKKAVTEAAFENLAQRVKNDPELTHRAIRGDLVQSITRQAKKDVALEEAVEILKISPPTDEDSNQGPDQLSSNFLDRFERYTEDASIDEIKEKWAYILASEIRKPGTFDKKTLRILDEIDAETAKKFNGLCKSRIGPFVPKYLHELSWSETAKLSSYSLINEGALGVLNYGSTQALSDGIERHVLVFTPFYFAIRKDGASNRFNVDPWHDNSDRAVIWASDKSTVAAPVVSLTEIGMAFASIIEDNSFANAKKFLDRIRQLDSETILLKAREDGKIEQLQL